MNIVKDLFNAAYWLETDTSRIKALLKAKKWLEASAAIDKASTSEVVKKDGDVSFNNILHIFDRTNEHDLIGSELLSCSTRMT